MSDPTHGSEPIRTEKNRSDEPEMTDLTETQEPTWHGLRTDQNRKEPIRRTENDRSAGRPVPTGSNSGYHRTTCFKAHLCVLLCIQYLLGRKSRRKFAKWAKCKLKNENNRLAYICLNTTQNHNVQEKTIWNFNILLVNITRISTNSSSAHRCPVNGLMRA